MRRMCGELKVPEDIDRLIEQVLLQNPEESI